MRQTSALSLLIALALVFVFVGCAVETELVDGPDDPAVLAGKADGTEYSDCELAEVVDWVNDPATSFDALRSANVHTLAARNLVGARDGADGLPGTADDRAFAGITEVDDVPYVGPVALRALVEAVSSRCTAPAAPGFDVIFSPQPYDASHLARTRDLIDAAERSIDIAMYSYSDTGIDDALARAIARGVSVRLIFDTANADRLVATGGRSAALEELGIDVRYVNKIMHHKFVIIDGVRTPGDDPETAVLATGSANWSSSGGTRYDENTLFITGEPELALRYQRELNYLWEHSRDFVWSASTAPPYFTSEPITDAMIAAVDDPDLDVWLTSANFRTSVSSTYGNTFSTLTGSNAIANELVALIEGAQRSIRIASGHMRSRPVAEALIAAHRARPDLEIVIYLDGQEFISESSHDEQQRSLDACLATATTDSQRADCLDAGFYFGYLLHLEGIDVRYKYYAYRWDFSYAIQMHHKFVIVDDETLVTGSYNLSDNAEHQTMENLVRVSGARGAPLVARYRAELERMWDIGRAASLYDQLLDQVENGTGSFPIVFEPMALDWDEVNRLKTAIRAHCPDINSPEYRDDPASHRFCNR